MSISYDRLHTRQKMETCCILWCPYLSKCSLYNLAIWFTMTLSQESSKQISKRNRQLEAERNFQMEKQTTSSPDSQKSAEKSFEKKLYLNGLYRKFEALMDIKRSLENQINSIQKKIVKIEKNKTFPK